MNKQRTFIFSALILLLVEAGTLAAANPTAAADNATAQQINNMFVAASSKANPSVVTIASERVVQRRFRNPFFNFRGDDFGNFGPAPEYRSSVLGSGVVIDAALGYIVTNNHVIENAEEIDVMLLDKRVITAEVIGTDPRSDVAVIKVDADNLQQAQIGNSDELRVGEWVLAIGSPFSPNLDHTVTAGIVSAKGRSEVFSGDRYEDYIQTDAAINPGNSGGALVNLDGELVGINTAIATDGFSRSSAGVGFAIPINLVMRAVDDLIEHGKVTRAYLGVDMNIKDIDASMAKALGMKSPEGVLVSSVREGTAAEKAGIKEEDVIIKVDDIPIRNNSHLRVVISSSRPGDQRKIKVIRDGKEKTITVKLDELPPVETLAARDDDRDEEATVPSRTGFSVADLDSREAQRFDLQAEDGVLVTRVDPRSKAARGGIRPGDVVVRIDDNKIRNLRDYRQALKGYKQGDNVLLRVVRGEVSLYVGLELS